MVDVLLDNHDVTVFSCSESSLLLNEGHLSPALGGRKHHADAAKEEKEGEGPPEILHAIVALGVAHTVVAAARGTVGISLAINAGAQVVGVVIVRYGTTEMFIADQLL